MGWTLRSVDTKVIRVERADWALTCSSFQISFTLLGGETFTVTVVWSSGSLLPEVLSSMSVCASVWATYQCWGAWVLSRLRGCSVLTGLHSGGHVLAHPLTASAGPLSRLLTSEWGKFGTGGQSPYSHRQTRRLTGGRRDQMFSVKGRERPAFQLHLNGFLLLFFLY